MELDAPVVVVAADPPGPPAPPSVGNPYCGLVQGDWADVPLSAGGIDIATEPFVSSTNMCVVYPLSLEAEEVAALVEESVSKTEHASLEKTPSHRLDQCWRLVIRCFNDPFLESRFCSRDYSSKICTMPSSSLAPLQHQTGHYPCHHMVRP